MEEPTQQGRNQRKVLTLSPTLFSNDVPWAKGATILAYYWLIGILPMLKVLTKPPTWEASRQKEAKLSTKQSFSPFSRNTRLVATLIQKVIDGSRLLRWEVPFPFLKWLIGLLSKRTKWSAVWLTSRERKELDFIIFYSLIILYV